jgi:hypothetical protein
MALHDWVSAPDVLEGCTRDRLVAVLSRCDVQLAAALAVRARQKRVPLTKYCLFFPFFATCAFDREFPGRSLAGRRKVPEFRQSFHARQRAARRVLRKPIARQWHHQCTASWHDIHEGVAPDRHGHHCRPEFLGKSTRHIRAQSGASLANLINRLGHAMTRASQEVSRGRYH